MENNVKTNKPETKKMKGSTKIRIFSLLLAGILVFGAIAFAGCESSKTSKELETAIDEQAAALAAANAALEKAIADAKADSKASSDALEQALADAQAASAAAQAALEAAIAEAVENAQKDWAEATEKKEDSDKALEEHYGEAKKAAYYIGDGADAIDAAAKKAVYDLGRAVSLEDAAKVIAAFDYVVQTVKDTYDLATINTTLDGVDKAIADTQKEWDETEDKADLKDDTKKALSDMSKALEAARKLLDEIKVTTVTIEVPAPTTEDPTAKKTVTVADAKARLVALETTYNTVYKKDVSEIRDVFDAAQFNKDLKAKIDAIGTGFVTLADDEADLKELKAAYDTLTANAKTKIDKDYYANFEKALARLATLDEARTAAGVYDVEAKKFPAGTINAMIADYVAMFDLESKATWTQKQAKSESIKKEIDKWVETYFSGDFKGEIEKTSNYNLVLHVPYATANGYLASAISVIRADAEAYITNVGAIDKVDLFTGASIKTAEQSAAKMVKDLKADGVYDLDVKLDEKGNTLTTYANALKTKKAEFEAYQKKATVALVEDIEQYKALTKAGSTVGDKELKLETWLETYGVKKVETAYELNADGTLKRDGEDKLIPIQAEDEDGNPLYLDEDDKPTTTVTSKKLYATVTLVDFGTGYALHYETIKNAIDAAKAAAKDADAAVEAADPKAAGYAALTAEATYANNWATWLEGVLGDTTLTRGEFYGKTLNGDYSKWVTYDGAKFDLTTAKFINTINYTSKNIVISVKVVDAIKNVAKTDVALANDMIAAVVEVYTKYTTESAKVDEVSAGLMADCYNGFVGKIEDGTIATAKKLADEKAAAIDAIDALK